MTMILIVIGALSRVTKGLIKGLGDLEIIGRVGIIQTTTLLRSARILRRVLKTCHSNTSEKPSANTGVKNSQMSKIMIMIIINGYIKLNTKRVQD